MSLKVHVQKIWPAPERDTFLGPSMKVIYDAQIALMRSILGPEAEIRVQYNDRSSYCTNCFSMEAYNVVGMLEGLADAEAAGCDVAMIACGNDPALQAARDALTIPVVSLTESAMLVACTLGRRFGLITMDTPSIVLVERCLESYRLEHRAISHRPVRSPGFYEETTRWFSDPQYLRSNVIPRFEEVARGMIEDGAEVIIAACGNYAAFPIHGYSRISGADVPVIEGFVAATHMAAMLGRMRQSFGLSTSKHSSYKGPPTEYAARLLAPFRSAARAEG
ncbi:MAG: aspartate/glutamate racemase family protein [Steroidobacteraceae bacterium]|jgi:allantoin racemase|nr:aspartate/glutamate racemase family protein [Steroidobacteraceae bacterium]